MGTIADWTDLHARFLVLAETWMQRTAESDDWVKAVDNFLKQFIAARSGKTDVEVFMQLQNPCFQLTARNLNNNCFIMYDT